MKKICFNKLKLFLIIKLTEGMCIVTHITGSNRLISMRLVKIIFSIWKNNLTIFKES